MFTVKEGFRLGMEDLVDAAALNGINKAEIQKRRLLLGVSAEDALCVSRARALLGKISLVVTSPPYPGVHVLYHRWQIRSRKETPAPFWIANRQDGAGASYYTMGGRSLVGERRYFQNLIAVFKGVEPFLAKNALVAQVVAFSDADRQLPLFKKAMMDAGYAEQDILGRRQHLSRQVPNRRWYARGRSLDAAREFILFFSANSESNRQA